MGGAWGGALSDLVRVPFAEGMLVPVPEGIEPATVASASDNLPDAWRAVGPFLQEHPGAEVLIVGGAGNGSIGLYATAIALARGAARVDYFDQDQSRLELAQKLGATVKDGMPPRRSGPYPVTVDASGNVEGLASALRATAPGGTCTSTAIYFSPQTPIPLFHIYSVSEITFKTGRVQARPIIPAILDLVQEGRLRPELVTTARASWEEAIEALSNPVTKLVITRSAG
jgi:alcohol dehydrogenase